RLADALAQVPDSLGERVRPLTTVLVSSERYGVALLPALERLAVETRLERRRAAEATARRVPVKLLFPLVLCTLPAFALLTVVPLLAGSLRSLRL
ncbi:MAG: type II secretion system F family protein, partial [Acidimicrobiales bacterium]|nr:type II secretion system F family protein [Acidimicrobiales bacterium]